ncbi:hypothetical protein [Brevibacillus sp. SIMBA_040]|uniref:hypothetical protein n=1 Tax=unclassified Brevibacillus TaxID=2684853 RepID=UPI00397E443E
MKTNLFCLLCFGGLLLFHAYWQPLASASYRQSASEIAYDHASLDLTILITQMQTKPPAIFKPKVVIDSFSNEQFLSTLQRPAKIPGIVDMVPPDYEITVMTKASVTQTYFLWIKADAAVSTLMDISNTHTAYTISGEKTELLKQMLKEIGLAPAIKNSGI